MRDGHGSMPRASAKLHGRKAGSADTAGGSSMAAAAPQQSAGMSATMQSAVAAVVLLGTVVLLMGSSLRQASHTAAADVASHASALSFPSDATKQKPGQLEALHSFRQMQARRAAAAPVATVEAPAPVATVEMPPVKTTLDAASCLITKWGAIWLMKVSTHERSLGDGSCS